MGVTLVLVYFLLGIVGYLLFRNKRSHSFWSERGVPSPEANLVFGHTLKISLFKQNMGEFYASIYRQFKGSPLAGIYDIRKPILVLLDPEVIGRVLVKDFSHFNDHGFGNEDTVSDTDLNLFNLTGNRWKALRNKIVPTFTTGRLKGMTPAMEAAAQGSLEYLLDSSPSLNEVELKEVFGHYASQVVGNTVFGIELGELCKPDSEFRKMGKRMFTLNWQQMIKFLIINQFPIIAKIFRFSIMPKDITDYFVKIVKDTLNERRESGRKRPDFVQLMLELRDKGTVEYTPAGQGEDTEDLTEEDLYLTGAKEHMTTSEKFDVTDNVVVSQAVQFLTSGFEVISLVMSFLCAELANNPEVQERVRTEVKTSKAAHQGRLTYIALRACPLLDRCLQETLRKYPVAQAIFRECTKDYTFPSGLLARKGQLMVIPVQGIHHDPEFYPRPEVFDPDRFLESQTPFTYLPFGDGPRICIGMRFAMLEIKLGVAAIIEKYQLSLSEKTVFPFVFKSSDFLLTPKDPIYFDLKKVY